MLKNGGVPFLQKKMLVLWSQNCKQLWTWYNMLRLCTKQRPGTSREKTLLSLHTRLALEKSQKMQLRYFSISWKTCDIYAMYCGCGCSTLVWFVCWHYWVTPMQRADMCLLDKIRFVLLLLKFCIDCCYTSIGRRPHELLKCCFEFRFIFSYEHIEPSQHRLKLRN